MGRLKRLVVPALLGLAAYWAVFGGEYSLPELREIRADHRSEAARLEAIREEIDSLRAWADSLEVDSATLEKLARERFGMIRDGELLYRFAEPDSGPEGPRPEGERRR